MMKSSEQYSGEVPTCSRGPTHLKKQIIMICLQKNCSRKRLCCLSCIDQLHCKHELISIKKFENYISNTLNHNMLIQNRKEMLDLIMGTRNTFTEEIEKLRHRVNSKIDGVIGKLKAHFISIQETFLQQKLRNVQQEMFSQFTDDNIQQIYKHAQKVQSNLVQSLQQINKAISKTQKSLTQKITEYQKQVDKHTQQIIKLVEQFKIMGKCQKIKIVFNQQTKASSLVLMDDNKTAKRAQGAGGYPIAVVNQPFSESNRSVSFTINDQPANKGIWMGVCVLDIVKNFNFQSCYGINKGTWAIDQVGQSHASAYSWSHHDTNYNSSPKVGWQFSIGDVVTISVDFDKSIVRFQKNQDLYYEQPIKLDLGALYAFAGPTHLNDIITIV